MVVEHLWIYALYFLIIIYLYNFISFLEKAGPPIGQNDAPPAAVGPAGRRPRRMRVQRREENEEDFGM